MQNPQPGPPPTRSARVAAGELAVVAAVGLAAVWGGTRAGVGLVATIVVTLAAAAAALSRWWQPRGAGRPVARPVAQPVFDDAAEGAAVGVGTGTGAGETREVGRGDATRTADGPDGTDVLAASRAQDAHNGFAGIARRLQAAVNQQLLSLRDMQTRHGDQPEVFSDLLHLDHGVSLIGRLADSLAVLGGVLQGRQWDEPVPLIGVVRGAMSRIVDYRRVDVDGLVEALATRAPDPAGTGGEAGDGPAFDEPASGPAVRAVTVEPVVHALAELLDNATRYSPPDTRVAVAAHRIGDGLVVSVADAGVGLTPAALRQAALALASSDSGLMRASGGAPRLGLTVVGRLAAAHGFQVTLEPGAGGGATARVYLPGSLLTVVADGPGAAGASGGGNGTDPAAGPPVRRRSTAAAEPPTIGTGGLPQRRRWSPGAEAEAAVAVNGGASYGTVSSGASNGAVNSTVNGSVNGGAHGGTANGTTPPQSQDPYDQAGLWLGAFRAGEDGQRS